MMSWHLLVVRARKQEATKHRGLVMCGTSGAVDFRGRRLPSRSSKSLAPPAKDIWGQDQSVAEDNKDLQNVMWTSPCI